MFWIMRRLNYFSGSVLLGLLFALPFAWLESDNPPSEVILYLLVYGMFGFLNGVLIEKRLINIGFKIEESFHRTNPDKIGLIVGCSSAYFLLIAIAVWAESTNQTATTPLVLLGNILLLTIIPVLLFGLYLIFAPENHKKSLDAKIERKKLEKELRDIKNANEIIRLKKEIENLKDNSDHAGKVNL